ncbi:coronin-2B-like isoform X3 [Pomacea canaliculata]|uniref:coronin-2B-like isoform X3 n=1 Tax=Pomacea canaliculata TaxID=400727 RepID=UPI000D73DC01|nr:coronin-2B-like isoform X3 [Pomacea canaliculata]XP_025083236.1 coronin-2B-like isoform X3 [Pomacea canaliculata]XP_025083237.1 coronin-2B-like isoform X3 [Pomacea canaliculata]XP_025083238.1 coronin-2B-like isoform X3 [Pomacea canaliculata]
MPMAFKIRSSKFRHVYGSPLRKEQSYENLRLTRNAHDSNFCAVNPQSLAVVTETGGGGSFVVVPVERTGRFDISAPKVSGHSGAVLDIKWNPFNDNIIASASEDCTVKLWQIPKGGIITTLSEWSVDLHGHNRRVGYLEWHPTAENIILSAGFDYKCIIWNVEQAEPVNIVKCHTDTIFSIGWNRDGSLFGATSKDKMLRVLDPRQSTVVAETLCHNGAKASKVVFVDNNHLLTTGFNSMSYRLMSFWDLRQIKNPLHTTDIDSSCGVLLPYYDYDTKIIFLAGKGDGNIRYYEVSVSDSCCHFLNAYQSSSPQRGLGMMPKRGCDIRRCEITRFYKLHGAKNLVEPISMIVPRKGDNFQEDIYPPTASTIPSLRADEWIAGQNREPILVSLMDGQVTNTPKITTSKAVQKQDGALQHGPTITTYKAVGHGGEPPVQLRKNKQTNIAAARPNHCENQPPSEPASIKNIKRLSFNEEFVTVSPDSSTKRISLESNASSASSVISPSKTVERKVSSPGTPPGAEPSTNGLPSCDSEHEPLSSQSLETVNDRPKLTSVHHSSSFQSQSHSSATSGVSSRRHQISRAKTISSPHEHSNYINLVIGEPSIQSYSNKIHIRKTWQSPPSSMQPLSEIEAMTPQSDSELKKAYFRQLEEINSLKEQVALKDKRIRQLEAELVSLKEKETSLGPGESNC